MPLLLLLIIAFASACTAEAPVEPPVTPSALEAQIARFAPVDIGVDLAGLPPNERQALDEMVAAARLFDGLFMQQVWADNASTLVQLAADQSDEGRRRLRLFLINKGPWSRLDENAPFVPGVGVKPPQANFYPADATKEEVQQWMETLRGADRDLAVGFFSTIRRNASGSLTAVPYSVEYQNTLDAAAAHLTRAASLTTQPTLRKFLELRAQAFKSNDYYLSDVAWMEMDATIEPTIGPYETYEDAWFGYKAAFEAFITVRDEAETRKLDVFGAELQGLENALPIDAKYRNPQIGAMAPMPVVNVVFSSGDGNRGVQTAAFNLPNDDRVIREKGSKRVMLKNTQEAKFKYVLTPIADVAIAAADRDKVSFDAFFTHILMHELMHGLGPHQVHGSTTPVREALKDTYGALEEAKADISGLWALQQLADKGTVSPEIARTMYTTFLASSFRSIRFGLTSAHGRGQVLQLNYLLDTGAVVVNADGTFAIVADKIRDAVANLTRDIMTMQAAGDYAASQAMLAKMVVVRPEVQAVLDKLKGVPVDIAPRFTAIK
jgi:Peptidase family M49